MNLVKMKRVHIMQVEKPYCGVRALGGYQTVIQHQGMMDGICLNCLRVVVARARRAR